MPPRTTQRVVEAEYDWLHACAQEYERFLAFTTLEWGGLAHWVQA
jgi:hypothetical protein